MPEDVMEMFTATVGKERWFGQPPPAVCPAGVKRDLRAGNVFIPRRLPGDKTVSLFAPCAPLKGIQGQHTVDGVPRALRLIKEKRLELTKDAPFALLPHTGGQIAPGAGSRKAPGS